VVSVEPLPAGFLPRRRSVVILPKQTAPFRPRRRLTSTTPLPADGQADPTLADAFHDLHGSRLHGFALLVSLGNGRRAEQAAGEALAAGGEQAAALRHPERAAAWLRARVLRSLRGGRHASVSDPARWAALASLGVAAPVYDGMAALSVEGRAALVASAIERFDAIDVETILGASPVVARRAVAQARAGYLTAAAKPSGGEAVDRPGPLATRVRDVANRAMASEATR